MKRYLLCAFIAQISSAQIVCDQDSCCSSCCDAAAADFQADADLCVSGCQNALDSRPSSLDEAIAVCADDINCQLGASFTLSETINLEIEGVSATFCCDGSSQQGELRINGDCVQRQTSSGGNSADSGALFGIVVGIMLVILLLAFGVRQKHIELAARKYLEEQRNKKTQIQTIKEQRKREMRVKYNPSADDSELSPPSTITKKEVLYELGVSDLVLPKRKRVRTKKKQKKDRIKGKGSLRRERNNGT